MSVADLFPEYPRIELREPPLELVVCQVQFPPVFALTTQPPSDFQTLVAKEYPIGGQVEDVMELQAATGQKFATRLGGAWSFQDKDSLWTVTLNPNFLALEAKRYRNFAEFKSRFASVLGHARSVYPIELRTRLGLRYVDRLSQRKHPKLPEDFASRTNAQIIPLRELASAEGPTMSSLESRFSVGNRILTIRSIYAESGFPGVRATELILDFDCSSQERRGLDDVQEELAEFRDVCYRAFRWSMSGLVDHFEPVEGTVPV